MDQSTPSWRVFDAPSGAPGRGMPAPLPASTPGGLEVQPAALLGIVAAIGIGVIAVAVALSGMGGETVGGPGDAIGLIGTRPPGEASGTPRGEVVIDVTGAVVEPGLYRLPAGSRVGDAVDAAGGFSPRVDAARVGAELNLAETLTDGAQVRVPSRDDPAPADGSGNGAGGGGGSSGGLVNLNSATQAELEALPGIGPVTAGKIMAARAETPFSSVDDLRARGLVGEKTFESIKALLTAD